MPNTKTLSILKCEENYDSLKVCACPNVQEINEILQCNTIDVNGETYLVDIYFGRGMKVLAIIFGLNGATAIYSNSWCLIHKDDIADLRKTSDFYETQA